MSAPNKRVPLVLRVLTVSLALAFLTWPASAEAVDDTTPPVGTAVVYDYHHANETIEFKFSFSDPESGLVSIIISCDGGPEATYPYAKRLFVQRMVPSAGGCTTFGEHTFHARVVNGAGLETGIDITAWTEAVFRFEYPRPARTGELFTVRPVYSDGYTVPAGAVCRWEVRWGNTSSLRDNDFDETFGGMLFEGRADDGFCGEWTFTLPWVPVPQFEINLDVPDVGSVRSGEWPDRELVHATVAGTDRRIYQSTLPIAQVLPSTYTPVVGQPVTYTRYLVGGASGCCNPVWTARLGSGETPIIWEKWTKSSTFTITPPKPGDLFVGWHRENAKGLLGAYYDPPVRRADTIDPNTTAPVQRLVGGTSDGSTPVKVSWNGTDKGWGIASYRLQRSVNGGAWTRVSLPAAKTTSINQRLEYGKTYRYRVRAADKAGNVGSWDYGPTFKPRRIADTNTAVAYSSGWSTVADATAHGGHLREARVAGKAARFTFSGRDVAWLAERGPGHGKAKVYIDGTYIKTVDLEAASDQPQRVVFTRHLSAKRTHAIRIVVSGTSGRPIVSLDGFAVLR